MTHGFFLISFSPSERRRLLLASLVAFSVASCGVIFSLLFGFSRLFPVGMGVFLFFLLLFLKDPFLFLLFVIPFRMMLDFFGEYASLQVTEGFSISLSQAIGLQVFFFGILFFVTHPRARESFRGLLSFSVFLAWAVFSLVVSINPSETLRDLVRVLGIFSLASIAFVVTRERSHMKRILASMLLASVVPIVFGFWQFVTGNGFPREFVDLNRIYGTFGHPNVFGLFLFAVIVLSFMFFRFFAETKGERIFSGIIAASAFLLLFPTLARVAWVVTLLFFAAIGLWRYRSILIPVIFIPLLTFALIPSVEERVTEALTPSADSSVLWRFAIWGDALTRTVLEGKVIFGSGLNTFSSIITSLHSGEFGSAEAHNDFVKFFVEGGIVGLSAYVFWMGWFVFRLSRLSRNFHGRDSDRELSFLFLIFLGALLLASLSDAVFKSTPIQWLFWISLGSFLGMMRSVSLPRTPVFEAQHARESP